MDLLKRKSMQSIVDQLQPSGSHIGARFFPNEEEPTEESIWDVVKAGEGLASFRATDAEARLMEGKKFDRRIASVTDMAAKRRLNITDIRAIREAGENPIVERSLVSQMAKRAERRITRELGRMREVVDNRLEWARMNALLGEISYKDTNNNVSIQLDYNIPVTQKNLNPGVDWDTVATSDPIKDLQTWIEVIVDKTGVTPTQFITSRKALFLAGQSEKLRGEFKYTRPLLTASDVQSVFMDKLGLTAIIYDSVYYENDTAYRFIPQNKFILLPDTDSLTGSHRFADTAVVPHPLNDYKGAHYVWKKEEKDPWGIEVGVGLTALPRIYQPNVILTADLW